jgi:hypothetical protein
MNKLIWILNDFAARNEIRAMFGPAVSALVGEVTDDKNLDKQVRKERDRSQARHTRARMHL